MDTPTKIQSVAQILRLKNVDKSSAFIREAVIDARSMLKGSVSDAEAETLRQKYRGMMTDAEREADDQIIEKKVFHEGKRNQRTEFYFTLLGGKATAVDSTMGDARYGDRSFYISFDPSVKDLNTAAYSDQAIYLDKVNIPFDLSNRETKARLEAIAAKMYAQITSGESLIAAAAVATMENIKSNEFPEEFDLLNQDVGEYFKSKDLSNVYKREKQRVEASLDLSGKVEPREHNFEDPVKERFLMLSYAVDEAERQARAINVIRRIAKTEGWTPPKMLTARKKELSALIERVSKEKSEIAIELDKKKAEEQRGKEAELKAAKERRIKEYMDSFLKKSTPIEQTSVAYTDSELGRKLSEYRKTLTGHLTEEHVQKAGQMVYDAVSEKLKVVTEADDKTYKEAEEKFDEARKKCKKCEFAYNFAVKASKPQDEVDRILKEWQDAYKVCDDFRPSSVWKEIEKKNIEMMTGILSGIRPLCDKSPKELKAQLIKNPKGKDVPAVLEALQMYPKEFVEGFIKNTGKFLVSAKKERGFWSEDTKETCVRRGGEASVGCALHELGHGLERACPVIMTLEKQFYDRRTRGCELEKLSDITGNSAYLDYEVSRKDEFLDPYMGKDYDGRAYELVSMGFDWFFRHPERMIKDPDYFKFIAGILTMVTP